MSYILTEQKQLHILKLLVEGNSISSVARLTAVHRDTVTRLMCRFGVACRRFLDVEMRDLELGHVECDEIWTYVRKKRYNITGNEPDVQDLGDWYLFVALDEETRLVPAFRVDRRNDEATACFMGDLASRLKWPKPHASDDHAYNKGEYQQIVRISTDAFGPYRKAVAEAFGPYAAYAQLVKHVHKENGKKKVEITKTIFTPGVAEEDISTSLVERHNLTIRTFLRRFARKSMSFSKKVFNLRCAVALHFAYYNYCWTVKTLKTTPAVAAGINDRRWTIIDLYAHLRERHPKYFLTHTKAAK